MPSLAERIPPHSVDAERSILGSMMMSEDAINDALGVLVPEDFYRPLHQRIFFEIQDLYLHGQTVDLVTVKDRFTEQSEQIYLVDLCNSVVSSHHVVQHAQQVKRDARLRRLIVAGQQVTAMAYKRHDDAASEALNLMIQSQDSGAEATRLGDCVVNRISDYGHPTIDFSVPYSKVRMHFGDLSVIAARPGVGKSALAIACAEDWAGRWPTRFYTYEMSSEELADRFIARTMRGLAKGQLDLLEQERYREATRHLDDLQLEIVEAAGMTLAQLYSGVKTFAARGGRIAIVDYLQLAVEDTKAGRVQDMSRLTKTLMRMAKDTGCAIVALSQFSRSAAAEQDKVIFPQLHHLRDSGTIEQDAANVCLMALIPEEGKQGQELRAKLRGAGFVIDPTDKRALLRLDWAKVRHGEKRIEWQWFDGDTMTFDELDVML